jgi:hypothetical protein
MDYNKENKAGGNMMKENTLVLRPSYWASVSGGKGQNQA